MSFTDNPTSSQCFNHFLQDATACEPLRWAWAHRFTSVRGWFSEASLVRLSPPHRLSCHSEAYLASNFFLNCTSHINANARLDPTRPNPATTS
jgi:hypothetical protein